MFDIERADGTENRDGTPPATRSSDGDDPSFFHILKPIGLSHIPHIAIVVGSIFFLGNLQGQMGKQKMELEIKGDLEQTKDELKKAKSQSDISESRIEKLEKDLAALNNDNRKLNDSLTILNNSLDGLEGWIMEAKMLEKPLVQHQERMSHYQTVKPRKSRALSKVDRNHFELLGEEIKRVEKDKSFSFEEKNGNLKVLKAFWQWRGCSINSITKN